MASQSLIQARLFTRPVSRARFSLKPRLNVRKDMLVIRLMLSVGLLIPALMAFHFIPASFLLSGTALALLAGGGVGWLIRCGEVA